MCRKMPRTVATPFRLLALRSLATLLQRDGLCELARLGSKLGFRVLELIGIIGFRV